MTMPENVGYITELVANCCYEGLLATLFWGDNWCEFVHGSLLNLS